MNAMKEKININITLSPACSSFDQFNNFEERGNYFKKIVKNIT
jgi:UDP-N-acetylmuramoylalanine--D-glutamate ligase